MSDQLPLFLSAAKNTEQFLQQELASLHAGRASVAILDTVRVEAYGVQVPLVQLANITIPEPRQLLVQPFDPQTTKEIERALQAADLGLSVVVDGKNIRLTVPTMTEERRQELTKVVKQKLELARVRLRQAREQQREQVIAQERDGSISEDAKFNLLKELDEQTKQQQEKLEAKAKQKEQEILTI